MVPRDLQTTRQIRPCQEDQSSQEWHTARQSIISNVHSVFGDSRAITVIRLTSGNISYSKDQQLSIHRDQYIYTYSKFLAFQVKRMALLG